MSIVTILSILVSSMIVYAAPLIFTSIGGAYSEHAGVVNVGLEGIMVMGAFSGIVFNLTFEPEFREFDTMVVLDCCCRDWSILLLDPRGGNHSFPC